MSSERMCAENWDGVVVGGSSAAAVHGIGDFHLTPFRVFSPTRFNSRKEGVRFGVREVNRRDVFFDKGFALTRPERTILDLILDNEDPSQVLDALRDARRGDFDFKRFAVLLGEAFGAEHGAELAAGFDVASEVRR